VYSTFLQRAYDQIIHDIALQQLPVTILIDRAGLVGEDGPTHHGVYDIAYLSCVPGIELYAPAWPEELQQLMQLSLIKNKPVAIRYPKGVATSVSHQNQIIAQCIEKGYGELQTGKKVALISCGQATLLCQKAMQLCHNDVGHFHLSRIDDFSAELTEKLKQFEYLVTVEDGCIQGGMGQQLLNQMAENDFKGKIIHLGVPDVFVPHGNNEKLYEFCGFSPKQIADCIQQLTAQPQSPVIN
jgi:1-deoxy-D-xylulose-5-phosphate synthase